MKKISYIALVGCLAIISATNCREWETSGWFKRASKEERKKTYETEVIEPAIHDALKALEKEEKWADKQADLWFKSYHKQSTLGRRVRTDVNEVNKYSALRDQARKDMTELQKEGKSIASGQVKPDKLSDVAQYDFRKELAKREKDFEYFYEITPEEVEAFMGKERKPSGAFFSPLEEDTEEESSLWEQISNWFK